MARAAAKRRHRRATTTIAAKHKDSGGQRFEDTLFFNRLRKQAKWVFVFLVVVFAVGFVLFGVGSSNLGPRRHLQQHRRRRLRPAVGQQGAEGDAAGPEEPRRLARPRDRLRHEGRDRRRDPSVDRPTRTPPEGRHGFDAARERLPAAVHHPDDRRAPRAGGAQNAQSTNFGPPATSPLGRALGSHARPDRHAAASAAQQRFSDALSPAPATAPSSSTDLPADREAASRPSPRRAPARRRPPRTPATLRRRSRRTSAFLSSAPDDPTRRRRRQQIKALSRSHRRRVRLRGAEIAGETPRRGDERELRHQDGATRRATDT